MAPRVCPAVCEHHPWCRVDCLVHDIGGNAPRCAGRELGTTQVGLARGISRGFFSPEFGQSAVFDLGSGSKREREERTPDERSRCVDRRHRSGSVRATGYKQRQRLPPLGQPPTRFSCRLNRRHSEADSGGTGDRSSVVAKYLPMRGGNSPCHQQSVMFSRVRPHVDGAGCVTQEMVKGMAPDPIIFAMANPDPEISYEDAKAARPDAIVATGRSDYPNQVNNVLGFPFIFRGALDVRATTINDEMKLAATLALASLAKEDVPDSVLRAYSIDRLEFGREYIIPKPFDPRVLIWEASAVAQAAMDTGVAQRPVDIRQYREELESRLGKANEVMRGMINKAQRQPKRIVFTEGEEGKILRACQILLDEKIALPILLGDESKIRAKIEELHLHLDGVQIVDPRHFARLAEYTEEFYSLRQRKGITRTEAEQTIRTPPPFGSRWVGLGEADALIGGWPRTI